MNREDLPLSADTQGVALTRLILTGYELRDGLVFPLDKEVLVYNKGANETLLLNDVATALANANVSNRAGQKPKAS